MQDLTTGELISLNPDQRLTDDIERKEAFQAIKNAAIPQRERQGPVFSVGEEIEIRGGKFRVHAITANRLYLDSIPLRNSEAKNVKELINAKETNEQPSQS